MHVASTHCESGHGRYEAGLRGSEAIEAEVSLKVWYVLHGTLRWASEAAQRGAVGGVGERSKRRGGVAERSEAPAGRLYICASFQKLILIFSK